MEEFFQMGGYASFIWPAYIIVTLVMVGLWILSHRFRQSSAYKLTSLNPKSRRAREQPPHEA